MRRSDGFTLLEVCVVLGIVGFLAVLSLTSLNPNSASSSEAVNKYLSDVSTIALAFTTYQAEKRTAPTDTNGNGSILDELSSYVFAPKAPTGFDSSYGYVLNSSGGQTFLCARCQITGAGDAKVSTLTDLKAKLAGGQFFYADACPSTTDTALDTAKTVYAVYYIVK